MNNVIDDLDKELQAISNEINNFEGEWKIDVTKDERSGKYVVLFSGEEGNCKHSKHMSKMNDYTFVFCNQSKSPIAIYCGSEVNSNDGAIEFVTALTTTQTLLHDLIPNDNVFSSPYFESLSKAVFNIKNITFV